MPTHFRGFGVPLEESRARMLESLKMIENLLAGDHCSFSGKYYNFDDITLAPQPVRNPFPTPTAAANSLETFELMGELGYPVFAASHINPFAVLEKMLPAYRKAFECANHSDIKRCSVNLLCPVFVGNSTKDVESQIEDSIANLKAVALKQIAPSLNDMSIFADVDDCIVRISGL